MFSVLQIENNHNDSDSDTESIKWSGSENGSNSITSSGNTSSSASDIEDIVVIEQSLSSKSLSRTLELDEGWEQPKRKNKNRSEKRQKKLKKKELTNKRPRLDTRAECSSKTCGEYKGTSHIMNFVRVEKENNKKIVTVRCRYCGSDNKIEYKLFNSSNDNSINEEQNKKEPEKPQLSKEEYPALPGSKPIKETPIAWYT